MKPLPERKALASAIALEAGAQRDLQVAERAAELAAARHWEAQSKLDELRKAIVTRPRGYLAETLIDAMSEGSSCNIATLERSSVEARAKMTAAENDVAVWKQTSEECELAVRAREADVAAAKERVERCARAVVCNAATVKRLCDGLEALQAEVISARAVLRFLWSKGVNGELPGPLAERIERLLWQLTESTSTSASATWSTTFDELLTNSDAELPGD